MPVDPALSVEPAPATPACGRCGRDAEYDFGHLWLCLDCYHIAGSTCAGVGRATSSDEASGVC